MFFRGIYIQPLKTIIALTVLILFVWTIAAVSFQNHKKLWRVINGVLAVVSFIAILFFTIIDRSAEGTHTMPFIRTIEHIRQQPELIREMVMNAFLFFPLGLCLPYALSSCLNAGKHRRRVVLITVASAFLLSGCIELIQYLYNFGNCELSDIIMNLLGAAIGSVSYLMSRKIKRIGF